MDVYTSLEEAKKAVDEGFKTGAKFFLFTFLLLSITSILLMIGLILGQYLR